MFAVSAQQNVILFLKLVESLLQVSTDWHVLQLLFQIADLIGEGGNVQAHLALKPLHIFYHTLHLLLVLLLLLKLQFLCFLKLHPALLVQLLLLYRLLNLALVFQLL